MIITALSDTHGLLPPAQHLPVADLFIHAGDICPATNHAIGFQSNWLSHKFSKWLDKVPARYKIIIAGNHDWVWYDSKGMAPELNCHYLENNLIEIEGKRIWGSPWTPHFNDWAFNFRPDDRDQARCCWAMMPEKLDILITHGPPAGFCDTITDTGDNLGCPELLAEIMRVRPKHHIFGHIHGGYGSCRSTWGGYETEFHNVSVLNEQYSLANSVTTFEI